MPPPCGRAPRAAARTRRSRPRTARRCRRAPPTCRCTPRRGTSGRASRRRAHRHPSPIGAVRCRASHAMPSTSRWLVGSSRKTTSQSPTSRAARPTRRRWPPERLATCVCHGTSASRPPMTSRTRASPAHTCSSMPPTTASATVMPGSTTSAWSSMPMRMPRRRVTRPASGSSRPASSFSSVDLPSPLRPTTPMRSPSSMPRVTSSKTVRVGNSRCRRSAPRRCAMSGSTLLAGGQCVIRAVHDRR